MNLKAKGTNKAGGSTVPCSTTTRTKQLANICDGGEGDVSDVEDAAAAITATNHCVRAVAQMSTQPKAKHAASKVEAAAMEAKEYFTADERITFRRSLLSWYDENHRVLPWRRNLHSKRTVAAPKGALPAPADLPLQQFAYYEWVSEIMLQQTQVATVVPYFNKWVAKWPTVQDLAAASIDEVNTLWAGLGFYRRARYLLDGAQYVVDKLGGVFPATAKQLLDVPGVGPYTSAAVASIAFGQPVAAVDGNVIRVTSRLRALQGCPAQLAPAHAAIARQLLDPDRPGDFNQALMELGATVCRAPNPDCSSCPVSGACAANTAWQEYVRAGGDVDMEDAPRVTRFPTKVQKADKRLMNVAVCVLEVVSRPEVTAHPGAPAEPSQRGDNGATATAAVHAAAAVMAAPRPPAAAARPGKKQRTMLDYALASRAVAADAAAVAAAAGATASVAAAVGGVSEGAMVPPAALTATEALACGQRHYLLVQRPEDGLLAGLWEFPGTVFEGSPPYTARKALIDTQLQQLLGLNLTSSRPPANASTQKAASSNGGRSSVLPPEHAGQDGGIKRTDQVDMTAMADGGPPLTATEDNNSTCPVGDAKGNERADGRCHGGIVARVLARQDVGSYVHIFSHIKQTNYVERLTVQVDDFQALQTSIEHLAQGVCSKASPCTAANSSATSTVAAAATAQTATKSGVPLAGMAPKRAGSKGKAAGAAGGKKTPLAAARPLLRWVRQSDIATEGLTSGVRRIYKLACG